MASSFVNAVLQTKLLSAEGDGYVTTINSKDLVGDDRPVMSIQVPLELVQMFEEETDVRAVSFLYYDVEELFQDRANNESVFHTCLLQLQ